MIEHSTSRCGQYDHPEIMLILTKPLPVPNIVAVVLSFFEDAVAAGERFEPGQTVLFGPSWLRISALGGKLGLEALESNGDWCSAVERALMRCWFQQEVAVSFGVEPNFAHQQSRMFVCETVRAGQDAYFLIRAEPATEEDSGWMMVCDDPDHDHNKHGAMVAPRVMDVVHRSSFIDQFLGLPVGTDLVIRTDGADGRARADVTIDDERREPIPGSYVAAM